MQLGNLTNLLHLVNITILDDINDLNKLASVNLLKHFEGKSINFIFINTNQNKERSTNVLMTCPKFILNILYCLVECHAGSKSDIANL